MAANIIFACIDTEQVPLKNKRQTLKIIHFSLDCFCIFEMFKSYLSLINIFLCCQFFFPTVQYVFCPGLLLAFCVFLQVLVGRVSISATGCTSPVHPKCIKDQPSSFLLCLTASLPLPLHHMLDLVALNFILKHSTLHFHTSTL